MLKRTTKPLIKKIYDRQRLAKSSKKQHSQNTHKWHLCKAGSFSYSESLRTPPLEGTSLHRWNNSVERPWGILSLFTTCLRLRVKSPCHIQQVVFHTVNHCGPLPLRELHSTDETIVWRDPRGSWACLPPVYNCVWSHPATGCDIWTTPEKYTKKRETLGNANKNKTARSVGYKKV